MGKLQQHLQEMQTYISKKSVQNNAVSSVSVGWHLDHCLIVIYRIATQVQKSNPAEFNKQFNWKRMMVFATNHIPRGKAKAPKVVQPEGEISEDALLEKFTLAKNKLLELDKLTGNYHFKHPYFDDLNVKQTQKFLVLHTLHHLKIVRDMLG